MRHRATAGEHVLTYTGTVSRRAVSYQAMEMPLSLLSHKSEWKPKPDSAFREHWRFQHGSDTRHLRHQDVLSYQDPPYLSIKRPNLNLMKECYINWILHKTNSIVSQLNICCPGIVYRASCQLYLIGWNRWNIRSEWARDLKITSQW